MYLYTVLYTTICLSACLSAYLSDHLGQLTVFKTSQTGKIFTHLFFYEEETY